MEKTLTINFDFNTKAYINKDCCGNFLVNARPSWDGTVTLTII